MSETQSTIPPAVPILQYLRDRPSKDDRFGPHSRIAAAIASTIISNRSLEVIGLLGPWGSGKSTVIHLLEDALKQTASEERVLCFQYDAWLYQSDPPRRSFLDRLIKFLIENELTSEARWKDRLAELNRQIEETDVQTTPILSHAGRWLIPLGLLVPFGFRFMDKAWLDAMLAVKSSALERVVFPIGTVLTLSPLICAGILWLSWRPIRNPFKGDFWKRTNFERHKHPFEKESILSLFINKEKVAQRNRTVKNPDPTTIEFQSIFREILEEVRTDKRSKPVRLVFIVDNLDRVHEPQAVEMWSTIRSFFLGTRSNITLPTVILPIDEKAAERMYAASKSDDPQRLAQAFMNKTFDLTFRVTPPVLSNWHRYIATQLDALFGPLCKEHWPFVVGSLFDRWLATEENSDTITPRQINTLLNEIGTLYSQWDGENISFPAIAYYAIFRDRIDSKIGTAVVEPEADIEDLDGDWALSVAAMHYGVPREQAAQVLLERRLLAVIEDDQAQNFNEIAVSPGFEIVLDQVLGRALEGNQSVSVNHTVALLSSLPDARSAWLDSSWRKLRLLHTDKASSTYDSDDVDTLKLLVSSCPPDALEGFLDDEGGHIDRLDPAAFAAPAGAQAIATAIKLLCDQSDLLGIGHIPLNLKATPDAYLKILSAFSSDQERAESIRSTRSDGQLVEAVSSALSAPIPPFSIDAAIRGMVARGGDFAWDEVVTSAAGKLQTGTDAGTASAAMALLSLMQHGIGSAKSQTDNLIDTGQLLERFSEAFSSNNFPALGGVGALILRSKNPAALTVPDGSNWDAAMAARKQLAPSIAKALTATGFAKLEDFVTLSEKYGALKPLLSAAAMEEFNSNKLILPSPIEVASNYVRIYNFVPYELDLPIVSNAAQYDEFWATLNDATLAVSSRVLYILLMEGSAYREKASSAALKKLEGLAALQWAEAIESEGDNFELTEALAAADDKVRIAGNLADGLRGSLDQLKLESTDRRSRWFKLAKLLRPASRKTLFRTTRDWLANQLDVPSLTNLLEEDNFALIEEGELNKRADDIVRNLIVPLFAKDETCSWLEKHSDRVRSLIRESTAETRSSIHESLQARANSDNESIRAQAEMLRRNLGLPAFQLSSPVDSIAEASSEDGSEAIDE